MKVKDFIKELEKLPQEAELFAKDEYGWFYPADIIREDEVYEGHQVFLVLGKAQRVECGKFKKEQQNEL